MSDNSLISNDASRGDWTSASAAEYDSLCPGRHAAQRGLSEPASQAASFGNTVHEAFDTGEVDELTISQQRLLEIANEREEKVLARLHLSSKVPINEIRLWAQVGGWRHSGQCDRLFLDFTKQLAVVEDLKSLRGTVEESSSNLQLRDLAVLVWLNYPTIVEVAVFINQPMAGGTTSLTRYTAEHLKQAWATMRMRITNSNDPNAKRTPGKKQCKFCRAKGICEESIAWLESESLALKKREESVAELVARISPEKLADIYSKAPTINAILDSVKARLLTLDDEQLKAIGMRRRPGATRTTVNDQTELINRLVKLLGATPEQVMGAMNLGKGDLETLVRRLTGAKGLEVDLIIDRLYQGIVEKKQMADQLVVEI